MTSATTPPFGHPGDKPPPGLPRWLSILLTIAIALSGIALAVLFVKTKPEPKKQREEAVVPLVEVATISRGKQPVRMILTGEVQPSKRVVVMAEVGGKVVWQHADLVPGGRFEKGETILKIDPRDYALALQQQKAQLSAQELNLRMEKGRQRVAEREWEIYQKEREAAGLSRSAGKDDGKDDGEELARRKPHIESAEVAVGAVKTSIAQAQLQLSRTVVEAPFNAIVQSENVDLGQLVSPAMQLVTLVGTDSFWVQVSIPFDKLAYVKLPGNGESGSEARVWVDTGHGRVERKGAVVRLLGDLDPVGRLARVLVEVDDPMLLEAKSGLELGGDGESANPVTRLPLLLGSFVHVEIEGLELEDVAQIPRRALQEDNQVYVLNADDTLRIEKVRVVWGDQSHALVTGSLRDGERLVTTSLPTAVPGMKLRVIDQGSSTKPERAPAPRDMRTNGGAAPVDRPASEAARAD